jgi:Na+-transporting methylmalonyl-CoA/oxaloacetate decarboxylase gamma subunit
MAEDMGEGLYLAAAGMGIVFLTLLVFMMILFALRKLFPGEEVPEDTAEDAAEVRVIQEAQRVMSTTQEPSAAGAIASAGSTVAGRIAGSRIAAMAVAMYLAMEQEEMAATILVSNTAVGASWNRSNWTTQGRDSFRQSQGHRPQAYGQKSHSAFSSKTGLRE